MTDIHDAPGRRLARTGRIATKAAIALTAAAVVTPMSVFGDNGTSLQDLWATFDQAVFAGMATPVLIWAANKVRLPPPGQRVHDDWGKPIPSSRPMMPDERIPEDPWGVKPQRPLERLGPPVRDDNDTYHLGD